MTDTSVIRILIVDDEKAQMTALCDTLKDHGYETTGFTTGQAALSALKESEFDLLLSDLMMPGMDGIALLQAALEIRPDIVGIIMTGEGTITSAVEAMKSGALDYILKPFKLSAILPVLSRALTVRKLHMENKVLELRILKRTEELEVANRELEAFSHSISHDLRAPLRAIGGFSEIITRNYSSQIPEEAGRLLGRVITSVGHMEQLIEDLLRFSKTARTPLSKQPVNMKALVHQVLEELQKDRAGRNIDLRVENLPEARGDQALLKQVYINLLSNAFKFTRQKEKAEIVVGSMAGEKGIVFFVKDNGAGFDMQYAGKLFGVFQRMHGKEEFEGTGVGLSIVQRIVQRHGGRIWVEAEIGKGATFYFTLPD